jgi:hypothetical protein
MSIIATGLAYRLRERAAGDESVRGALPVDGVAAACGAKRFGRTGAMVGQGGRGRAFWVGYAT